MGDERGEWKGKRGRGRRRLGRETARQGEESFIKSAQIVQGNRNPILWTDLHAPCLSVSVGRKMLRRGG